MTVYLIISLQKIPYMHRIYMVLANPNHFTSRYTQYSCLCRSVTQNPSSLAPRPSKPTDIILLIILHPATHNTRVGQNRIYTPYMTVYLIISLQKLPYMHRIYMVLANPNHFTSRYTQYSCLCRSVTQNPSSLAPRPSKPTDIILLIILHPATHNTRVGQNRIYTPYMTVYLVISLQKIPYMHRIYMVLANATQNTLVCVGQ